MSIEHTYPYSDESTASKTNPSIRDGIGTAFVLLWLLFVTAVVGVADAFRGR